MIPFLRSLAAAAMLWLLLPMGSAFSQSVQVKTLSADYTNHQVTFSVSWAAGTRDDKHLSKVWVFVDYAPVITDNALGAWQRANISTPTPTAGTISGLTGQGFFLQGTTGAFSTTVTVTLSGVPDKYSWCAHATDYPPNAILHNGTYILGGTPPFIINGTYTESSFTYSGGLISSLTDETDCPGIVIADPVIATTSPAAVCAGTAVTLTATTSGGTTTAMTYTWNINGVPTTTTANSFSVPAASVTTSMPYSVTVTNAYNTTSNTASGTISVNAPPTFTSFAASPATVCTGGTSTLTIAATGAASYSFDNGSTWQTANTYVVSPTGNTTFTAKVRSAAGCEAAAAKTTRVTVIADPTITITGAETICYGTTGTNLTATVSGGNGSNTLQWQYSADNSSWSNVPGGTASTQATGVLHASWYYRAVVTQSTSGCANTSSPVLKTVYPQFTAGAINAGETLCAGEAMNTMTSAIDASGGDGNITYIWVSISGMPQTNSNSANYTRPNAPFSTISFTRKAHDGTCNTNWVTSAGTWVVTVNPVPEAPAMSGAGAYCGSTTITATPGKDGDGIRWTDTGSTAATRTVSATGTYHAVSTTAAGCESSSAASVAVTINTIPDVPTMSGSGTQCGGTRSITATKGANGTGIRWTDTGSTVATRTVNTTGTYYAVSTTAAGCESAAAGVTVTINTVPDLPTMSGAGSACGSKSIIATPGTNGDGIRWLDDNSTVATRTISTTGTYYAVSTTAAGCESSSNSITVTITSPATNGQTANACGCASGLTNCSGTCKTNSTYTTNDGACFAVGKAYQQQRSACGALTNSTYGSYTNTSCKDWTSCGISSISNVANEGNMTLNDAITFCANKGMRLPTFTELWCLCSTKYSLPGGSYGSSDYWSNTANGSNYDIVYFTFSSCSLIIGGLSPSDYAYVKCVK